MCAPYSGCCLVEGILEQTGAAELAGYQAPKQVLAETLELHGDTPCPLRLNLVPLLTQQAIVGNRATTWLQQQ